MTTIGPKSIHKSIGKWMLPDGMPFIFDPFKSQGHYLHDARTGKDLLDLFCFFAARPLSFNHPGLDEPDFVEHLGRLALHKPSNCDVYTEEYANFVETFGRTTLAGKLPHLFFIEGGAPAVDNAIKAAMDWKKRKNAARGLSKRSVILHFKQAFHGRTGYALSCTDSHDKRKTEYFELFDWPRVTNPKMAFPFDKEAKATTEALEAQAYAEIEQVFDTYKDEVAAILIEPIQGEGGDNYFRSEFLQGLRRLCDEREALLIFDEVQTGFVGTGLWWDFLHHGMTPDILVFGKKTQVCGIAAGRRMDEVDSVFHTSSRISSTFSGNLVDMARCRRIIEIIEKDLLINNATKMGRYMLKLLADLAEQWPQIENVRGRGLWAAFDLPNGQQRDALVKACYDEELLINSCGTRTVRLRPALDIDAESLARSAAQMEAGFKRVSAQKAAV